MIQLSLCLGAKGTVTVTSKPSSSLLSCIVAVHLSHTLHLSDCEGDLECFYRDDGDDGPPGCLGTPYIGYDYCFQPLATIEDLGDDPVAENLSRCTGDCDSDR